jgi:hypothetical protein
MSKPGRSTRGRLRDPSMAPGPRATILGAGVLIGGSDEPERPADSIESERRGIPNEPERRQDQTNPVLRECGMRWGAHPVHGVGARGRRSERTRVSSKSSRTQLRRNSERTQARWNPIEPGG